MLNMFNFEQLVAETMQLAQTGNKLHGNKLHVWTGLNGCCTPTFTNFADQSWIQAKKIDPEPDPTRMN